MSNNNFTIATTALTLVNSLRLFVASRNVPHHGVNRRFWVRELFLNRGNTTERLLEDMRNKGVDDTIKKFIRLTREDFNHLLALVRPRISRQNTNMRESISALQRLCIALRFLATGDSYASLSIVFRVSVASISTIVPEVCDAIIDVLKDYIVLPSTNAQWKEVSAEFERKWNCPHAIGAIDGKHVCITAPKNTAAEYYNYKQFYSIVLMAIVDANYNFIYVDVGCQGRVSDGGVFANSSILNHLENNTLNIPSPEILRIPYSIPVPYMLLGDKAFSLSKYMLTPFAGVPQRNTPERIFNFRHSRARRTVENAFGILSNVFRVLRKPMLLEPKTAEKVVLAAVYLHNYSRKRNSKDIYMPVGSVDREVNGEVISGSWRSDLCTASMLPLEGVPRRSATDMQQIRSHIAHDFTTNNVLSFQYEQQ